MKRKQITPEYTLSRCRKNDDLYGKMHGGNDCNKTLCDLVTNENWWIVTNNFDGQITCPKCLKIIEVRNKYEGK